MGLDMYLNRKHYVQQWDHQTPEERFEVTVTKGGKPYPIDPTKISEVTEQVMYWRKANAIHKWFVDNVQDGTDDCGEYYVSREQLEQLRDVCAKVIAGSTLVAGKVHNGTRYSGGEKEEIYEDGQVIADSSVAEKLLPTGEGFFFGSTDYNEWYFNDVHETAEVLTKILAEPDTGASFYYQSSW